MKIYNPLEPAGIKRLVSAFSSRPDGNMSLSYGDLFASLDNRKAFLGKLDIDAAELVCAKQVHGKNVEYAGRDLAGRGALDYESALAGTDGLITDKKNLPLAVFTADCLSVFVYDPRTPALGLLHAGWRSSESDIAGECVRLMQEKFASLPEELLVGFGPAMRACCYEVAGDFRSNYPSCLLERGGRRYLDIAMINRMQLMERGVRAENIFDRSLCTYCSKGKFFSFRREAQSSGRMLSVMMLT